jgi:hypothetical protein
MKSLKLIRDFIKLRDAIQQQFPDLLSSAKHIYGDEVEAIYQIALAVNTLEGEEK